MTDGFESSTSGHTTPRIRLSLPPEDADDDGNGGGDDDNSRSVEPMYAESDAEHESPPTRVHFRSRVRIASGLNRHRHELSSDLIAFSAASSRSCSPSSSISVPLRSPAEDDVGRPGWGTLGQRVSLFAQGRHRKQGTRGPDEHSPLLTSQPVPCVRAYPTKNIDDDNENWDGDLSITRVRRHSGIVVRLTAPQWLRQQIVSVICCHCLAESDDEHS